MAVNGATLAESPQRRLSTADEHTTGSGSGSGSATTVAATTNVDATVVLAAGNASPGSTSSYQHPTYAHRPPSATHWAPSLRVLMEQAQSHYHYGTGNSNRNSINPSPAPPFTNFSHPVSPIQQRHIHAPFPLRPGFRGNISDDYDLNSNAVSPIMSRSPSVTSDRHSVVSGLTNIHATNLQVVHPQPAYVSGNSAAQVVSEHRAKIRRRPSSDSDEGIKAAKSQDDVQFSDLALVLVNQFLDQLLFTFLSTARSTSLLALRPAVQDTLKGRLSKEAIASAEEELKELLGTGEEEEINTQKNAGIERTNKRKWDLELVWRRTRLRVMVYTRLGEMEDEDEERYVRDGDLFAGSERRFSQATGLVSWAAAIFLTSVLEYIAEQTLQIAGQAAFSRAKRQSARGGMIAGLQYPREGEPVTVEEYDVEKVALNAMLGRLWRTWRKTLRNNATNAPQSPISRSTSRLSNTMDNSMGMRRDSVGAGREVEPPTAEGSSAGDEGDGTATTSRRPSVTQTDIPDADHPEHVLASNIPLPIGEAEEDISEIEIPGLARDRDLEQLQPPDSEPVPAVLTEEITPADHMPEPAPAEENESNLQADSTRTIGGLPTPSPSEPHEEHGKLDGSTDVEAKDLEPIKLNESVDAKATKPEHEDLEAAQDKQYAATITSKNPEESKSLGKLPEEILANQREQKFHASDMADIKRRSLDFTSLIALEKGMREWDLKQSSRPTSKEEERTLSGVEETLAEEDKVDTNIISGAPTEPVAIKSPVEPTTSKPENHDRRKSLINIKDLINTPESEKAAFILPISPQAIPGDLSSEKDDTSLVRKSSNESRKSKDSEGTGATDESFTLGEKSQSSAFAHQSPARPQHMPQNAVELDSTQVSRPRTMESASSDGIGVAKTSDYIPGTQQLQNIQTRSITGSPSKRGSRLLITDSPRQVRDEYPATAPPEPSASSREFLSNRAQSSQWEVIKDDSTRTSPSDQTRYNTKRQSAPQRAVTLSDGPQRALDGGKPVYRQSWSAAFDEDKSDTRPKSLPPGRTLVSKTSSQQPPGVLEHPVVQRMASLKDKGRKASDEDVTTLTSANIRGPEDFEMFVQGDETVKYTLTPENVRDLPKTRNHDVSTLSALEGTNQRKAPPPIDTRLGRSSAVKEATAAAVVTAEEEELERKRKEQYRRSISRPAIRNTNSHRKSGLMAREPRVQTESTQDLADFLRSTGPSKVQAEPRPFDVSNRSSTSLHSLRPSSIISIGSRSGRARSMSPGGDRTKSLTQSAMDAGNVPPVPSLPGKARGNMQARDATGGGKSNTELIDFIRTGPNETGEHRISRSVAPFRTTMDSDQMRQYGDGYGHDRLQDYNLATDNGRNFSRGNPNRNSGTNVRNSLLSGAGMAGSNTMTDAVTAHPAYSGQMTQLSSQTTTPSSAVTKKRFRNKDPYAIDLDEEYDDHLTALPGNKPRGDTLIDFLNSDPRESGANNTSRANSMISTRSGVTENGASRGRSMQAQSGPRPGYASSVKSVQSNHSHRSTANAQTTSQSFSPATALPGMGSKASRASLAASGPASGPGGPGGSSAPAAAAAVAAAAMGGGKADTPEYLRFTGEDPEGPDGGAPAPIVGRGEKRLTDQQPKEKRGIFGRRKSMKKGSIF